MAADADLLARAKILQGCGFLIEMRGARRNSFRRIIRIILGNGEFDGGLLESCFVDGGDQLDRRTAALPGNERSSAGLDRRQNVVDLPLMAGMRERGKAFIILAKLLFERFVALPSFSKSMAISAWLNGGVQMLTRSMSSRPSRSL